MNNPTAPNPPHTPAESAAKLERLREDARAGLGYPLAPKQTPAELLQLARERRAGKLE